MGDGQDLQLTGQGRRIESWIVVYGVALYLPSGISSIEEFRSTDVPMALRVEIASNLLPDTLPQEWRNAIRHELPRADIISLRDAYATLRPGDVVLITYLPTQGSGIIIDGRQVVSDSGRGLMNLFIDHWLGQEAVSAELRSDLLAGLP